MTGTTYTGGFQRLRSFILHWNGRKWHRVTGPADVSIGSAAIGGSGLWAVTQHARLADQGYTDPAPGLASSTPRRRVTLAAPELVTYAVEPSGVMAMPHGEAPTGMLVGRGVDDTAPGRESTAVQALGLTVRV